MNSVFRVRMLAAVIAGGVLGVALRELLLLPFTTGDAATAATNLVLPVATMGVNVLGSFGLGALVGAVRDRHPLSRAFLGTGLFGGFTTYSAFALNVASLLGSSPVAAFALAGVSVLLGLLAAALGLQLTRSSGPPAPAEPKASR